MEIQVKGGASWSFLTYFSEDGLYFNPDGFPSGDVKLNSITLKCAVARNPGVSVYKGTGNSYTTLLARAGALAYSTISITLTVEGEQSNRVQIRNEGNFVGQDSSGRVNQSTGYVKATNPYTFTFSNPPKITANSRISLTVEGVQTGKYCLAIRSGGGGLRGTAEVNTEVNPTSISIQPNSVIITDKSGYTKNNLGSSDPNRISYDYTTTTQLIKTPSDSVITDISYQNNNLTYCWFDVTNNNLIFTAKTDSIDATNSDSITVSVNGGASTTVDVYYFKKPNITIEPTTPLDLNIRTVQETLNITTETLVSEFYGMMLIALLIDDNYATDVRRSGDKIELKPLLDSTNSQSAFSVDKENTWHNVKFRRYNSTVQGYNVLSDYRRDAELQLRWSITPNMLSQFSYDWLDSDNNKVDTEPKVILYNQNSPIIGNLKYTNEAITGGWCRGFRVEYFNEQGMLVRTDYLNTVQNTDGSAEYKNKILTDVRDLPKSQLLTIKITAYFYYDDAVTVRYYGMSTTISQKLLIIDDEDLLPDLVFPVNPDSTENMKLYLENVERYGYKFPRFAILLEDSLIFGLTFLIEGDTKQELDLPQNTHGYFSSAIITEHIVVNVGRYIKENKLYNENLKIIPYIKINAGTTYEKIVKGNATITNTLELWTRPVILQGDIITYYDVDRFLYFINKYKPLVNNTDFSSAVRIMSGNIINTDFWLSIAAALSKYSIAMQDWATDVSYFTILWSTNHFDVLKGTKITNDNLAQNYYDLLSQYNNVKFATYKYLNDKRYTHSFLHTFTHNEITNREGL